MFLAQSIGGAVLVGELRAVLKEMSCPQNALISEHLSPPLLNRVTGKVGRDIDNDLSPCIFCIIGDQK